MLTSLRKAAKTKTFGVLIGGLVLSFALWGVADVFRGSVANVVAEVGDSDITAVDFDRELRGQLRALGQQMNTEITMEQAQAMGMVDSVLDNMISRAALDQAVARLGLSTSDEQVAADIRRDFAGADGSFNPLQFQQTLRQIGFSEAEFVQETRANMTRAQLLESIGAGLVPPPGLTRLLHDIVNETRSAEYVVVTPADAGAVAEPTEAQLAEYHRQHPERFSAPEYRNIDYVEIGPMQVADKVQVTDAELQEAYRTQRSQFETPEQREIEQISFPDKASADAAAAKLAAGTSFAEIARERGLSDEDYKLGSLTRERMDPRLAEAAFATAEGAVSAPVQGPFGWVILRPVRVTPGVSKSFEEAREELRQTLIRARGQIHIQEMVDALEDARAGGAALGDAARNLNLMVRSVAAVDARGMTPAGARAEIPEHPAFLQQVFGLEAGDESDPFRTDDDHSYVVKINGITPTALKPLAEVRDAVREAWTADARAEAVRKRADEIAERARTAGLAAAAGRAPMVVNGLRRDQPSDVLSAAVLQEFFGQPVGGVVRGPAMTAPNYVVARAASIQHPPLDPASPAYTQFRGQMANELSLDLVQTLANAARAEVDVETHPDVIQAALGQAPQ